MTDYPNFSHVLRKHGSLRYYVLWILSNEKKRGIDIMDEMERRSMGFWKPSPGSVYPILKSLVTEGLIRKNDDGTYELTDNGYDLLGLKRGAPETSKSGNIDRCLDEVDSCAEYLLDMGDNIEPYLDRIRAIGEKLIKISNDRGSKK